jgi:hypothetical protein
LSIFCGVFSSGVYKPNANVVRAVLIPPTIILWFFYAKGVIFESKDRLVGLIGFALLGVVMLFVRELLDFYVDSEPTPHAS